MEEVIFQTRAGHGPNYFGSFHVRYEFEEVRVIAVLQATSHNHDFVLEAATEMLSASFARGNALVAKAKELIPGPENDEAVFELLKAYSRSLRENPASAADLDVWVSTFRHLAGRFPAPTSQPASSNGNGAEKRQTRGGLSDKQVAEIRRQRTRHNFPAKHFARKYGVPVHTIRRVWNTPRL